MAAFVNQIREVNRVTLSLIADVEGKRLCPAAREAVRNNMAAAAPANDFTNGARDSSVTKIDLHANTNSITP